MADGFALNVFMSEAAQGGSMAYANFAEFRVWRRGNPLDEGDLLVKRGSEA